jgi:hypothetical protein
MFYVLLDAYNWILSRICHVIFRLFFKSLQIPKLHILRYHVIPSIQLYGSTNGMSTETYETLHKSNVKNPYRMTNKRDHVPQMLNTVCYITLFISLAIVIIDKNSINVNRYDANILLLSKDW